MTVETAFAVRLLYEEADADQVTQLLLACGWTGNGVPSPSVLSEAAMTGCAFVATAGDKVIGFIRVISDGECVSYVTEVAVDREWRSRGIGRALVNTIAREFPKARIDLLATSFAEPFYERIGFTAKRGYRRWP
jgi:predicted N-acetyltransferase YhbS